MHRKSRQNRRPVAVVLSILAALILVIGAVSLSPATAESGMSQLELARTTQANCQVLLAKATTSAAKTRARQCIADQQVIIDALSGSPSPSPSATQSPSPSPSPTVQPSPTVSPTATTPPATTPPPSPTPTGCQSAPAKCGFPDAATTGPTGTLLPWIGGLVFKTAGEVVSDTVISGCVEVRASDVTFRNVQFNATGCFWGVQNFAANLQVVDSSITCGGYNGTAFGSSSLTLQRVEIIGCENGLNVSGSTLVIDSWIHDMNGGQGGAHTDGAQFNQGATDITFRHNTIDVSQRTGATSAIIMWDEGDPQNRRVTLDGNLFAGGTYSVYCGRSGVVDNIRVTNNRFGTYEYGSSNDCNNGETWFGNVVDATGAVLTAA